MAEDAAYRTVRATARACALASTAAAPPIWLFSQLTPYHFLFFAPTTLSWFGSLVNVWAFTGYLLAAAAIPTYLVYGYVIGLTSRVSTIFPTLLIISMAVIHFYHGVMGYGPPNAISRTIGVLLLLPVAIRWIVPVWRFFRAHPLLFVPVAYAIGIVLAVLMEFAYASPSKIPQTILDRLGHTQTVYTSVPDDGYSFYTTKNVLEFGFWDWLAAGAGALVYLVAVTIWRKLLKPSTPEPEAD